MHVIPPYEAGVTLHRLDGTSKFFRNRRLLLVELGIHFIRYSVGHRFDEMNGWLYVILDDEGRPLSAKDFEVPRKLDRRAFSPRYGYYFWNGTGPVPNTSRRRGGHAYRRIGTLPERRDNDAWIAEEGEPRPRARRRGKNLPSSWDDLCRSDYGVRSWKKHRKTKWKS